MYEHTYIYIYIYIGTYMYMYMFIYCSRGPARGPESDINIRISYSGSTAHYKGYTRNHVLQEHNVYIPCTVYYIPYSRNRLLYYIILYYAIPCYILYYYTIYVYMHRDRATGPYVRQVRGLLQALPARAPFRRTLAKHGGPRPRDRAEVENRWSTIYCLLDYLLYFVVDDLYYIQ